MSAPPMNVGDSLDLKIVDVAEYIVHGRCVLSSRFNRQKEGTGTSSPTYHTPFALHLGTKAWEGGAVPWFAHSHCSPLSERGVQ